MDLEDLLIQHNYRVEKINGKIVATLDEDGNYKGTSKEDIERALKDGSNESPVFVSTSRKWNRIKS